MNPKEFFKRWAWGIRNLSPAYQAKVEIIGLSGNIFGLTFAWYFLILRGMWYFSFIMLFTIVLQSVALIGAKQRHANLKDMEAQLGNDIEQKEVENNGV